MAFLSTNYPGPVFDDATSWICFCPPYDDGELERKQEQGTLAGAIYSMEECDDVTHLPQSRSQVRRDVLT